MCVTVFLLRSEIFVAVCKSSLYLGAMQIQTDIPAPTDRNPTRRITPEMAAEIDAMPVGASVLIQDEKLASCIMSRLRNYGKKPKKRPEDGGHRVWRVA